MCNCVRIACRYQRGSRSLLQSLGGDSAAAAKKGGGGESMDTPDDEEYDIPDELEEVIGE
jgi:hypothetical protein